MKIKRQHLLALALLAGMPSSIFAKESVTLTSPDQRVTVKVSILNKELVYQLNFAGKTVLEAARLGVTAADIATTLRVATIGDVDAALAKLSIDNRLIPIRVQLDKASSKDLRAISALKVITKTGASVPLSTVADVQIGEGPSMVKRLNRSRQATIGAGLPVGVALGTAKERLTEIVAGLQLPAGAVIKEAGDAEG